MGCCKKRYRLKDAIEGKEKLCVWMLGEPGSGKETQCANLAAHFQLCNLSPKDLLRDILHEDTPLANEIRTKMEKKGIVDTKIVLQLLGKAMEDAYPNCRGYIIDGYPREIKQGKLFCKKIGRPHAIIYLEFSPMNILVERLLARDKDSGQEDENDSGNENDSGQEKIIQQRLETYHGVSKPVVEHWTSLVARVDATGTPEEVDKECKRIIRSVLNDFSFTREVPHQLTTMYS